MNNLKDFYFVINQRKFKLAQHIQISIKENSKQMKRYQTQRPSIKKENRYRDQKNKSRVFSQHQSVKIDKPQKIKNKQNVYEKQFYILKPSKKHPQQIKKLNQVFIQQNQKEISSNMKFNTIKQITVKYFNKKRQKDTKKSSIKSIDQQITLKKLKIPIRFSFKIQKSKIPIPVSQRCKRVQSSKNINRVRLPQPKMRFYQKIDQQLNETRRNFKKEKYLQRNQNRSKSQFKNIQPQRQKQKFNNNFLINNQFYNQLIKQQDDEPFIQFNSQALKKKQRQQMKFQMQKNQKIQQNQEQFIQKNSKKFNQYENIKYEQTHKEKQKNRKNKKKASSHRYVVDPFEKIHIKSKFLKKIPNILSEFLQSRIQVQKRNNLDKFDQVSIIELQKDEESSTEMFITGEQLLNFKIFDL